MESRQDDLVKAMMEEVGGTIGISMFQMGFVPGLFRMAAGAASDVKGEIIPADHATARRHWRWPTTRSTAFRPGS